MDRISISFLPWIPTEFSQIIRKGGSKLSLLLLQLIYSLSHIARAWRGIDTSGVQIGLTEKSCHTLNAALPFAPLVHILESQYPYAPLMHQNIITSICYYLMD
jgi:hypothetical protein